VNDIKKLHKLDEKDNFIKALTMAIASEITLYVMNTRTDAFVSLPPGQIQRIFNDHPEKTDIAVEKAEYDKFENIEKDEHIQIINFLDLWLSSEDYLLVQGSDELAGIDKLKQSKYWNQFEHKLSQSIEQFPLWEKSQHKIHKTKNLTQWLEETIDVPPRTVQIYINILSEIYDL